MYTTTFFTLDGEGSEIAGDLRSRLEWRVARRAAELAHDGDEDCDDRAWARAEEELAHQLAIESGRKK